MFEGKRNSLADWPSRSTITEIRGHIMGHVTHMAQIPHCQEFDARPSLRMLKDAQELRGRKRPVAQMVPEKERSPSAVRAGTSKCLRSQKCGRGSKIRQTALTNVLLQNVGVPTFAPSKGESGRRPDTGTSWRVERHSDRREIATIDECTVPGLVLRSYDGSGIPTVTPAFHLSQTPG
ncbi:hypothetical protein FOZ63_002186, partial [Perkinsus olseni]